MQYERQDDQPGRYHAICVVDFNADGRLWMRNIGDLFAEPIRGTEGARNPFFSPDGTKFLFADKFMKLHLVDMDGGVKEIAASGYDADEVARAYVAWCASDPFDIGGTTMNAFSLNVPGPGDAATVLPIVDMTSASGTIPLED